MNERDAFIAAWQANPDDDAVKLVFADWLDEHDEPRAAERLRWWCAVHRPLLASILNEHFPLARRRTIFEQNDGYRWRLVALTACRSLATTPGSWDALPWPEGWSGDRFTHQFQHAQTSIEATLLEVLPWMELTAVREPLYELMERAESCRQRSIANFPRYLQVCGIEQLVQRLLAVTQDWSAWEYWLAKNRNGASNELQSRYKRGLTWLFGPGRDFDPPAT